jgi:uncharacterized protein YbjT (DUF2867 family)
MHSSPQNKPIAVVGATGHTGRFVLDELERRGLRAILVARDARKLAEAGALYPGSSMRPAHVDDPASLDSALSGAAAVVNCAGPFLDTALPVVEAALRARIPYLDVAAEQAAVQSICSLDAEARRAEVTVLPAAAFYGGLADLLASAVSDDSSDVDDITVAVALDSWHPTKGTRITGARNTVPRLIVRDGILQPIANPQPTRSWAFPAPFGEQEVAMVPFSETITLSQHLKAATIESWINLPALRDVRDSTTPPPQPVDERRRSAQRFVMDVLVRTGERRRRATAFGRDIYASSAPIIVEALQRVLADNSAGISGVRSLGEIFDARAFLEALARRDDLRVEYQTAAQG